MKDKERSKVGFEYILFSLIAIIAITVIVMLAANYKATGRIVQSWPPSPTPNTIDPSACRGVPACGSAGYMCCAKNIVAGLGLKCVAPMYGQYKSEAPICPTFAPNVCDCPERFQFGVSVVSNTKTSVCSNSPDCGNSPYTCCNDNGGYCTVPSESDVASGKCPNNARTRCVCPEENY